MRTALLLVAVALSCGPEVASCQARTGPPAGTNRAPSGPPLGSGSGSGGVPGSGGEEAGAGETTQGEADPLVDNGLGSPLCRGALGGGLSAASRRDCETSGFVAAPAPTSDYGIDVHIDTGVLGFSEGGLESVVQDLFVTPLWMALVWAVHALVVLLEWCFTIDLLDSASAGGVGRGLRQMQSSLTGPWLASVLAVASVLAAYNGLVRRRVAETVGEALVMLAMMAGGLWVIVDPTGTVGALGSWANQASLGTLAVTVRGAPVGAGRALADSMGAVFAAAIEAPWCYLEFGDVGWCRDPARRDPRLHAAGLQIAAAEEVLVGCRLRVGPVSPCVGAQSAQGKALKHSAQLLRGAPSNGAIFLALPADGPARNSINEQGSLLRTLCQSGEASACRGPTAAQAEFRTGGHTWSRVGGLLLIVAGVLGMLLALGFVALRLLAAALFSLMYLLLAPIAVLAPALGDGGRAAFRKWAARLLGAVVSKLLYSFLLGVVLVVVAILGQLRGLGWWTQWLLTSAFWWGAFARRHQALGVAEGAIGRERSGPRRSIARRVGEALETPRAAFDLARRTKARLSKGPPSAEQRRERTRIGRERAREMADAQVARSLEREHGEAGAQVQAGPDAQARLAGMRGQLERVRDAREGAVSAGDTRRAAKLGVREERIAGEIAHEEDTLRRARRTVADGEGARRRTGEAHTREQREGRARWLDVQAALPAGGRKDMDGERRDYAALAGLAGHGRGEYERLDPRRRREARLQIDRELALRKELGGAAADVAGAGGGSLGRREKRRAGSEFDRALGERMRATGHRAPSARKGGSRLEEWKREGASAATREHARSGSPVLDDAREVAARRKRQLGRDRR
ncbi:MAG TPA: hypothetical protein VES65_02200 [Solirubrobacteraceae bacterium]|nr:hypothetical protein [Solirubrobacteraceae bacterium]